MPSEATRRPTGLYAPTRRAFLAGGLALAAGCSSWPKPTPEPAVAAQSPKPADAAPAPSTPPGKHHLRLSQYVFYSDFDLDGDAPLFRELVSLRDAVYRELRLPPADTVIQVFLFESQERYENFIRVQYPELPPRRAFFISQPRGGGGADELLVYSFWGDYVRQDLRHELTHALLHSVIKDVPLWLDEGLAEFFESPPESAGLNRRHLIDLRSEPFRPDLERLERLRRVRDMGQPEYREAWAWVHWMLRGSPAAREALLTYLRDLRRSRDPRPLIDRLRDLTPDPDAALAVHVAGIWPR